jgi:hypothetical protein
MSEEERIEAGNQMNEQEKNQIMLEFAGMNTSIDESMSQGSEGQFVKGRDSIRQSIQGFVDMKGKLESKVKRVLMAADLALVISEWSFNGTSPDGNPVNIASIAKDVPYVNSQMVPGVLS